MTLKFRNAETTLQGLNPSMKTIIAGGRNLVGDTAKRLVREAVAESGWSTQITEIVHGGARGIDSAADEVCSPLWTVKVFPADWNTHGKSAGAIRNRQMAEYADALIAIWDGETPGTRNMIETATKKGLKVFVKRVNRS